MAFPIPINLNALHPSVHFTFGYGRVVLWTALRDTSEAARLSTCAGCDGDGHKDKYTQEELSPCSAPGCRFRYCNECRSYENEGEFYEQMNSWRDFIGKRANSVRSGYCVHEGTALETKLAAEKTADFMFYVLTISGWCVSCTLSTPRCPSYECGMRSMVDGVCVSLRHVDEAADDSPSSDSESVSSAAAEEEDTADRPVITVKRKSPSPPPSSAKRVRYSPPQYRVYGGCE